MLTHFVVSDHVARSRRFHTGIPSGTAVVVEGEPPATALANNRIIIHTRGGPTDAKPSLPPEIPARSQRDQPAAHPMALINPATTAITSKSPSASRSPRRRANQAGRRSSIAAEHLLCAARRHQSARTEPPRLGGSRTPCGLQTLTICNEIPVLGPAKPGVGRVDSGRSVFMTMDAMAAGGCSGACVMA